MPQLQPNVPSATVLPMFTSDMYTAAPLQVPHAAPPRKLKRQAEPLEGEDPTLTKRTLDFNASSAPSPYPTRAENPFQLKESHLRKLKDYILCVNGQPWSDERGSYQAEKKSHEKILPSIAGTVMLLVPQIMRHKSSKTPLLTVDFTVSHKDVLSKIFNLLHGSRWDGIYLLLPWANMTYPTYGTIGKPQPSLSAVEAHRRILRMEEANATMIKYIDAVIRGGQSSIRVIAAKHLADAYAVLTSTSSSSVAFSAPELIYKANKAATKLPSHLGEQAKWLNDNRNLGSQLYLTELDWGVPILALFHSLLPSLGQLDNETEARAVLAAVTTFCDKRASVYTKTMGPVLVYGAKLTQYTADLQALCYNFTGLGIKAKVPYTQAGRFHELDVNGKLLGIDGRVLEVGLDGVIPAREKWLLPFPIECMHIVLEPGLAEICRAHAEEEKALVDSMLAGLNIRSPPLLSYRDIGNERVNKILSSDSFELGLTDILAPSASMRSARYQPEMVFGAKADEESELSDE